MTPRDNGRTGGFCSRYGHGRRRGRRVSGNHGHGLQCVESEVSMGDKVEMLSGDWI